MKRLLIATLFASLLIGSVVTDAAATEIVILQCRPDWTNADQQPLLPYAVVGCTKSAGLSLSCPDFLTSCAQALANYLSLPGVKIKDTHRFDNDGLTYILEK